MVYKSTPAERTCISVKEEVYPEIEMGDRYFLGVSVFFNRYLVFYKKTLDAILAKFAKS